MAAVRTRHRTAGAHRRAIIRPSAASHATRLAYEVTALITATARGDRAAIADLASMGVDVNLRTLCGHTPLHIASRLSKLTVVLSLMRYGARLDARTMTGHTVAHAAAQRCDPTTGVLHTLIRHGAAMDARTVSGETPLLVAARAGRWPQVGLLLSLGANRRAVDVGGRSVLYWAAHHGEVQVVTQLARGGGPLRTNPHHQVCAWLWSCVVVAAGDGTDGVGWSVRCTACSRCARAHSRRPRARRPRE